MVVKPTTPTHSALLTEIHLSPQTQVTRDHLKPLTDSPTRHAPRCLSGSAAASASVALSINSLPRTTQTNLQLLQVRALSPSTHCISLSCPIDQLRHSSSCQYWILCHNRHSALIVHQVLSLQSDHRITSSVTCSCTRSWRQSATRRSATTYESSWLRRDALQRHSPFAGCTCALSLACQALEQTASQPRPAAPVWITTVQREWRTLTVLGKVAASAQSAAAESSSIWYWDSSRWYAVVASVWAFSCSN